MLLFFKPAIVAPNKCLKQILNPTSFYTMSQPTYSHTMSVISSILLFDIYCLFAKDIHNVD